MTHDPGSKRKGPSVPRRDGDVRKPSPDHAQGVPFPDRPRYPHHARPDWRRMRTRQPITDVVKVRILKPPPPPPHVAMKSSEQIRRAIEHFEELPILDAITQVVGAVSERTYGYLKKACGAPVRSVRFTKEHALAAIALAEADEESAT